MNNANDTILAVDFIKKNFIKSDAKICSQSSYWLKHALQYATNVYMTEQDFVKLMEELGYKRSPRGKWKLWLSNELKKFLKEEHIGFI
jgi:hypothetical protein